jgi:hypothetical protein
MVAGFEGALRNIDFYREEIRGFVERTCRAGRIDPCQQMAIFVGVGSNVGQEVAADIAGPQWVDRHVGTWVMGDFGRRRAEGKWRGRGTTPPQWPFTTLGSGSFAVWLAPFDGLPAHLTWLWNDATWLDGDHWETHAPDRPAGSMPCVVQIAGHWRLWIQASTP